MYVHPACSGLRHQLPPVLADEALQVARLYSSGQPAAQCEAADAAHRIAAAAAARQGSRGMSAVQNPTADIGKAWHLHSNSMPVAEDL